MNELQIVSLENTEISAWDFESIKSELAEALSVYKSMVYTDDSIKSAKDDKALLAKVKKLVEDQRKAYKAKCLAPYDAIEPKIKEIVSMIEEQRVLIDDVVKDYTERQKQEKLTAIKAYYDKKAFVLGADAERLFERLLDPKWLNASTAKKKYEEEIQLAINKAAADLETVKKMNSLFVDTLIDTYCETCSIERVQQKQDELQVAYDKAGLSNQVVTEPAKADAKPVASDAITADASDGVMIKVYGSKNQLTQVTDFMKAIGVRFEVLEKHLLLLRESPI